MAQAKEKRPSSGHTAAGKKRTAKGAASGRSNPSGGTRKKAATTAMAVTQADVSTEEDQITVQDLLDLVKENIANKVSRQPTAKPEPVRKSSPPPSKKSSSKDADVPKAVPVPQKKPRKKGAIIMEEKEEELSSEPMTEEIEEISWSQQISSIVFGILSLLMTALIVFPGEKVWTVIHNFLYGIFGFKVILWNLLLVISGYLFAKQKEAGKILEIIQSASGIIVFSDILNYILIQSNCYRNVENKVIYGPLDFVPQIYNDGSRVGGTGLVGGLIGELLIKLLGKAGGAIVTILILLGLCMFISHTTPVALIETVKKRAIYFFKMATAIFREDDNAGRIKEEPDETDEWEPSDEDYAVIYSEEPDDFTDDGGEDVPVIPEEMPENADDTVPSKPLPSTEEIINKISLKKKKKTRAEEVQEQSEEFARQVSSGEAAETEEKVYRYPSVKLLIASMNTNEADDKRELTETANQLIQTLSEYGVKASISDISRGPTVTRYEINPAPGVKINKITNLSNDIALRLAAQSIRIEAPIPGKPAVGIEIPNQNKQMVRIREILGSKQFMDAKGALTVALGKDIEGNIVLCDLSKMPHLLIAGSTGSGKSVCVNSMLISLLYKYSPQDVRMVLIDPKSVEFDMYNGIPHLLVPVVCEPKKAAGALQWAVSEMLKRYGMLKERGVRNIDNYNRMAEKTGEFEKLCRIVIVIDEMADLMIASPKEVEDAIARLAAMARAAGMYMVLATQRPSVDVITGTIKNNIPSRIALAVSSQIDSRTILDEGGAENLIGYGDMLYHPMGASKHTRVQGCFVDDMEVDRVIQFVKQNGSAEYDDSIADEIERNSMDNPGDGAADFDGKDEFFEKAVEVVTEAGQASTSMLQRRLGVGYARAGRIIDQLEEQGIIGPYEGSKPRAVLITRTQWLEMTMSRIPAGKDDPLIRSHSEFAAQTLDNGHEEITARQSEFFNARQEDDDAAFDDLFTEDTDADSEEAVLSDATAADDVPWEVDEPADETDGDADNVPWEVDEPADETDGDADDVPWEVDEPADETDGDADDVPWETDEPSETEEEEEAEDGEPDASDNDTPPAADAYQYRGQSAPPRDLSIFFDDEDEEEDETYAVPDKTEPSSPEKLPVADELADDDDEDEDDIFDAPWVKIIRNRK